MPSRHSLSFAMFPSPIELSIVKKQNLSLEKGFDAFISINLEVEWSCDQFICKNSTF